MEELIEILEDIRPDVDFRSCNNLVDNQILTSFDILSIISEISDAFGISVTVTEVVPENFNSAEALWAMIGKLKKS